MARVSVIMAVYNAARYLHESVGSILSQTYRDFELVIVDDASRDGSAEILKTFDDPRVRVITHETNKGAAASRNDAVRASSGELIAVMDADDISLPSRLDIQVRFLDANPRMGLVGCAIYDNIDVDGFVLYTSRLPQDNETIQRMLLEKWCFVHPSVMFRREAFDRVGGYRSLFETAEDQDFILRVLEHYEACNLPEKLVRYRINPKGLSVEGHDYINKLGDKAMELAKSRRRGQGENLNSLDDLVEQRDRRRSVAGISRWLHEWRATYYAANRCYGFGCRELYVGDLERARECFERSLQNNRLFLKAWIGLALSFMPFAAERVRFLLRGTAENYRELEGGDIETTPTGGSLERQPDEKTGTVGQIGAEEPHDSTLETELSSSSTDELKRRTTLGALTSIVCQSTSLVLRIGSMMVLARMLSPTDFGLVAMVTAITGFAGIFKEAGLSDAAVQSSSVNQDQLSMLFWINLGLGCAVAAACAVGAPMVADFYNEPRLFWVMLTIGSSFIFTGLSVQHRAILLRNMRIQTVAVSDLLSLALSVFVSLWMAFAGLGYWALVAATVVQPAATAVAMWLCTAWVPGLPRRGARTRGMIKYGGTITLNSAIVHFAYNAEKVLLGRFWGAEMLGIYGRGYQLLYLCNEPLQSTAGSVAFPALSRIHTNPVQLRNYFLRIYSTYVSVVVPVIACAALFADDLIAVALGPQWTASADVVRRLGPAFVVFALINPFSWLMFASGQVVRSLVIGMVIAPVVVLSYVVGLGGGPNGVAFSYSVAMAILALPVMFWSVETTSITKRDLLETISHPAGAVLAAGMTAIVAEPFVVQFNSAFVRLTLACAVFFSAYLAVLLLVFGHLKTYIRHLRHVRILNRWLPADTEAS